MAGNYINKRTGIPMLLNLLKQKFSGSFLAFIIHDAIVLDMKNEDRHLLKYVKSMMSSTNFGSFMVNTKKGSNLGNLREVEIV